SVARRIRKLLKQINPDIVHLHSTFPGVYGRIIFKKFPVVYCPHGWSFVQESGAFKKKIYAGIERFLARRCDAIVNISRHEYDEAIAANIKSPRDVIIASGVDDVAAVGIPVLNCNPDHINIGYIGRLDYKKGFDIAAEAFAGISRKDLHLYVIGDA